jgi:uncharacterized protein with GYD domain
LEFERFEFDEARLRARFIAFASASLVIVKREEMTMPTFLITMSWTGQGIRNIKDAPKRAAAARETAKKLGVEIKETYVTTGESDLLAIVESASGDHVAKFCMAIGSQGNVRTRTVRAWSQADYAKLISELP